MDSWRKTSVISNRIISNQRLGKTEILGKQFLGLRNRKRHKQGWWRIEGTHSCHCWRIEKRGCMH